MNPVARICITAQETNIRAFLFQNRGPAGPVGSATGTIQTEVPTGLVNGSNRDFTVSEDFVKLWVYKNGVRQYPSLSYIVTGSNTFQFVTAPETGDELLVDYIPA
jgi:hypothetical protein